MTVVAQSATAGPQVCCIRNNRSQGVASQVVAKEEGDLAKVEVNYVYVFSI